MPSWMRSMVEKNPKKKSEIVQNELNPPLRMHEINYFNKNEIRSNLLTNILAKKPLLVSWLHEKFQHTPNL